MTHLLALTLSMSLTQASSMGGSIQVWAMVTPTCCMDDNISQYYKQVVVVEFKISIYSNKILDSLRIQVLGN